MQAWLFDNAWVVGIGAIVFVPLLAVILHLLLHEKWATVVVPILATALLTVWANNFLTSARDRDARLWTLRQEHLARLRPVLLAESERLAEVARRITVEGRVTDINRDKYSNELELKSLLDPDFLSPDVVNHYRTYSQEKDRLRADIETQENEFADTETLVMTRLSLPSIAEKRGLEVARSYLEKCLEKGPGITLTQRQAGYVYRSRIENNSVSGYPGMPIAADHLAAFKAFTSFRPDAEVAGHCENMKRRGVVILDSAKKLSAEARGLAERTTLPGTCEYTRLE